MEVNELRIGNIVLGYDDLNHIIDLQFFVNIWNGVCVDEMIRSPILLTEEWLLKLGFERESLRMVPDKFYYSNNTLTYYTGDNYLKFCGVPLKVDYVHQLQNLHFALTGEELTIK